jgi:hypothetical protein
MYGASEQILEIALQGRLLEQARSLAHIDEHIEIAARRGVTACDRPEDLHSARAMALRDLLDLGAALTELTQIRRRSQGARVRVRRAAALHLTAELAKLAQPLVFVFRWFAYSPERTG